MKQVLLIADGSIALHFIRKVIDGYSNSNVYIIVYKDKQFVLDEIPSTCRFHECDYTSEFRLNEILLDTDISDAFIILDDEKEGDIVYKYLRAKYSKIRIVRSIHSMTSKYADLQDSNLVLVTLTNAMASRLLLRMPNVPVIPRGFGLEQGEVMEIGIPVGSIYSYRQVGTIQQSKWKIIGIYRSGDFHLANADMVIWPGDRLLAAGEPKVMKTVYDTIKSEVGQFPSPFGREICLIIDMSLQDRNRILFDCKEAIYIHRHLRSTRLIIKVLNVSNFDFAKEIESFSQSDVEVLIDYKSVSFAEALQSRINKKIGLIILGKEIFAIKSYRKMLYKSKIPIFKTSRHSICPSDYDYRLPKQSLYAKNEMIYKPNVESSLLVIEGDNERDSDISTLIFDISKQLGLNVCVYDFEQDGHFNKEVESEFDSLSRIFEVKFSIEYSRTNNPIFHINSLQKHILLFLPFSQYIAKSKLFSFMRTRFESIAFMFDNNPQILLPINDM